jgi:hypothetical protein
MSDVLVRIKRAVLAGRYVFSEEALIEEDRFSFLVSSQRAL